MRNNQRYVGSLPVSARSSAAAFGCLALCAALALGACSDDLGGDGQDGDAVATASDATSDADVVDATTSVDAFDAHGASDAPADVPEFDADSDPGEVIDAATDTVGDVWAAYDEGRIVATVAGCSEVLVPTRWDFGWENRNHRISRLGWLAESDGPACSPEAFVATFVGGDFTTGAVDTDNAVVSLAWSRITFGTPRAAVVRLQLVTPPTGTRSGSFVVDRAALGLPAEGALAIFVQGLSFDTDIVQQPAYTADYDPALGYTSRGLGAAATLDPAALVETVQWWVRFEPGIAFDVFLRSDHNEAVQLARTAATLDLALVVVPSPVFDGTLEYTQITDEPYDMTTELEPPAPEAARTLALTAEGSGDSGFVGVAGFDMRLYPDGICERNRDCDSGDTCGDDGVCMFSTGLPGDYVRRLAAGVERVEFTDQGARATVVGAGYASTASEAFAFRPLNHAYSSSLTWVRGVDATEGSGAAVFGAGSFRFDTRGE
jgi:hypothetical protein